MPYNSVASSGLRSLLSEEINMQWCEKGNGRKYERQKIKKIAGTFSNLLLNLLSNLLLYYVRQQLILYSQIHSYENMIKDIIKYVLFQWRWMCRWTFKQNPSNYSSLYKHNFYMQQQNIRTHRTYTYSTTIIG